MGLIRSLDRAVAAIVALGRWLVIPVVLLLFLQWPLRDLVRAYSRQANDVGQWTFALVVAVAVTAATRARAHLAADAFALRYAPAARRRIEQAAALLVLIPWALFLLVRQPRLLHRQGRHGAARVAGAGAGAPDARAPAAGALNAWIGSGSR